MQKRDSSREVTVSLRQLFSAVAVAACTVVSGCQDKANLRETNAAQGVRADEADAAAAHDHSLGEPASEPFVNDGLNRAVTRSLAVSSVASPRASFEASEPQSQVTSKDLLSWSKQGVSEEMMVDRIERVRSVIPLTAAEEQALRDHGVSQSIVDAMKCAGQR